MGVADIIDVEEQDEPPTPSARKRNGRPLQGDTEPPPPESPAYGHPGGAGGAGGGAWAEGGGARFRVGGEAAG